MIISVDRQEKGTGEKSAVQEAFDEIWHQGVFHRHDGGHHCRHRGGRHRRKRVSCRHEGVPRRVRRPDRGANSCFECGLFGVRFFVQKNSLPRAKKWEKSVLSGRKSPYIRSERNQKGKGRYEQRRKKYPRFRSAGRCRGRDERGGSHRRNGKCGTCGGTESFGRGEAAAEEYKRKWYS